MKKKLLSLLLVLCMVIPMVPMTVLAADTTVTFYDVDGAVYEEVSANYGDLVECPAYGVEDDIFLGWDINNDGTADYSPDGTIVVQRGYTDVKAVIWKTPAAPVAPAVPSGTSAFYDNLPTYNNNADAVFNGNWEFGSFRASDGFYKAFTACAGGAFGDLWSTGGFYNNHDTAASHYRTFAVPDNYFTSLVHRFDYDASLTLNFNNVTVIREDNTAIAGKPEFYKAIQMDFAIYKNDTLIWPLGDADADGDGWHTYTCDCADGHTGSYYNHGGLSFVEGLAVSVEAGDVISFRARRTPGNNTTWMLRMNPSVTYVSVDENSWDAPETPAAPDPVVTKTSSSEHQAKVVVKGGSTAMFSGNWSYVSYHKDNMNTTYTLDIVRPMDNNNYLREDVSDIYLTDAKSTGWSNSETAYYGAVQPGRNGSWGYGDGTHTFAAHWLYTAGWRYVTEHAGVISIDITTLSTLSAAIIANGNAAASFAIFHNGKMIWPVVDGQYNAKADWFYSASQVDGTRVDILAEAKETTTYASLSNVFVEKGDEITFLVRGGNGHWTCRGNHMGMDITYKHIFTEDTVFVSEKGSTSSEILEKGDSFTFPEYKGNNLLIFGGWDIDDDGVADYQPGQSITLTGNVVYAGVDNGVYVYELGTADSEKDVYAKGATFTFPEYTGAGFDFRGWDVNGDGVVDYVPGDKVTVNAELVYGAVTADLSFSRDEVSYTSDFKAVLPIGWSLLGHNASNFNDVQVLDTLYNLDDNAWKAGPSRGTDGWFVSPSNKGGLWDQSPAFNWLNKTDRIGGYWGPWMGACPTGSWNAAYAFTAPYAGYVNVAINEVKPDTTSTDYIAVFVGGIMVWPTAGGSYTNVGDWHYAQDDINDTDLTLLNNLFVESGEKIEIMVKAGEFHAAVYVASSVNYARTFDADQLYIKLPNPVAQVVPAVAGERVTLPEYAGSGAFLGWDANGDGAVDYTDGQTFTMPNETVRLMPIMAAATTFHTNLPTYNADNSVTYNGGWKAGVYDIGAGKFVPFNYGQKSEVRFSFNNRPWDGSTAAMYSTGRFAMSETVVADGRYNVAVQYTTEMSGNITVDFANLQLQRETNSSDKPGYVAGGFAIYHNGVKIAPVDADYYYYKSANTYAVSNSPVPTDEGNLLAMFRADGELTLDVKKGDTIEVRAFKDDSASRMFIINPTINYNSVTSAPVITATSVTIGETFTMNVFASLNAPRHDYTDEVYLVIGNGYELPVSQIADNTAEGAFFADVDYVFEIPELPLRYLSMTFDVYMRVYYEDGTYKDSKTVTIGAAEYAKAAIASPETDNELKLAAAALLEYSVASDAYFYGYDSSDMLPDDMPLMPTIVPENVFNLTEFDGDASISGATLTLTETVGLRVYVKTAKNPGRFVLLVDDNEEFSSPRRLQLEKRPSGGYMVDIEVSAAEFSDAFYFCVEDINGDQQSEVLTYSVESYVARQYENEDASEELLALLDAMLVLCKTANDVA